MKVSIEISEVQILKALALAPATEEQSEAVLAAVRETPELDLTETVRNDKDYRGNRFNRKRAQHRINLNTAATLAVMGDEGVLLGVCANCRIFAGNFFIFPYE